MASIALSSIGSSVGGSMMGNIGSMIGQASFAHVGHMVDQKIFGGNRHFQMHGAQLKNQQIQTCNYGQMIPIVYGKMRIAGNIIWSAKLKEVPHQSSLNSGAKGSKITQSITEYSYLATFAISICEGELESVNRVWANNQLLNLNNYNIRIYMGSDTQLPDPIIEAIEGYGKTPAYRNQAYVVFQDFPITEFGNVIPNLVFEVKKKDEITDENSAENLIDSVVIIPGCGEFVYDTCAQYKLNGDDSEDVWCARGKEEAVNKHAPNCASNAMLALDQLQNTLKKVTWVAPTVSWFATSLNIENCKIMPGVEFSKNAITKPDQWHVGKYNRANAHQISVVNEALNYGGSVNDESILRYLDELKARDYKVMFYPLIFIDTADKPWRGRISGDAKNVVDFFNKEHGYNDFILHYAQLVKGKVDAFIIGSEMIGLTKLRTENGDWAAVKELVKLAAKVKGILGNEVAITYAADWSEYHHTSGGWYNLDELWASDNIDFVGIDAYFPITNSAESVYDIAELQKGWQSGEGFDFYYEDSSNKLKAMPLSDEYAWKNINWWWGNTHYNPDGSKTSWQPKSKKIWFTEFGYPSVDCASNQPNVFHDPKSSESAFPIHSKGNIDLRAQRSAIEATLLHWKNSQMVERMFLWTWDARPYPYWPDMMSVWSDGEAWAYGHWVQGKLGTSSLANAVSSLCKKAQLSEGDFSTKKLNSSFNGMIIEQQSSIKNNLELLSEAYFFDSVEHDANIDFSMRDNKKYTSIPLDELLYFNDEMNSLEMKREEELLLPKKVDINFINQTQNYTIGNQHAVKSDSISEHKITYDLPIALNEMHAKQIAFVKLFNAWLSRDSFSFALPTKYAFLKPGDNLLIDDYFIKIKRIYFGNNLALKIEAVADHNKLYQINDSAEVSNEKIENINIAKTRVEILDVPTLPDNYSLYKPHILIACAGVGENWKGAQINISYDGGKNYTECCDVYKEAAIGNVLNDINKADEIIVNLMSGEILHSNNSLENMALIGNEIVEFSDVQLIGDFQYKFNIKKRSLFSTKDEAHNHNAGDRFILLNNSVQKFELPLSAIKQNLLLKAVSFGNTLGETQEVEFKFLANNLKPFSVVNIQTDYTANGDLEIKWDRSSRMHSPNSEFLPIGEESEKYKVSLSVNEQPHQSYIALSNEFIIFKEDLPAENFKVDISQLSATIGEGFGQSVLVEINI